MATVPLSYFTLWLASGERGLSSEAIVSKLTGHRVGRSRGNYPRDPDDFRRCQLLLRDWPRARQHFDEMRSVSGVWDRLVDAWDEIHTALEAEAPNYLDRPAGQSAPNGYALMKRIIAGAKRGAA